MATAPGDVDRRGLTGAQAGLIIGGLLLVLLLVWFFLLRGGGEDEAAAPAPPPAPTAEPAAPGGNQPGGGRRPGRGPVETFEVFAPKDPFRPLVDPDAGAGGAAAGGTTAGGTTTNGGTTGGTTGGTGTGAAGGGVPGGGGGGQTVEGHRVRLIDVFSDNGRQRAQVQVDGTVYTVDEGERFADNFKLMSTSGQCATLLFGDDQFTLCEGEEILK